MTTTRPNFIHPHPFGPIFGWFTEFGLARLHLPRVDVREDAPTIALQPDDMKRRCTAALTRYFDGHAEDFADVPLDMTAASDFQRDVWNAARAVPFGETATYGELAERLGRDKSAARAVGHALGQNPIAIIVPCHRFIAANGNLTGYAAGLAWKEELLRIERSALC